MITQVVAGLDHPECVTVSRDGTLIAGGEAGQLYKIDPETGQSLVLASTGGWILGLAVDGDDLIYACDPINGAVFVVDRAGGTKVLSRGSVDRPMVSPNFPAFGPDGNLYVSDSGTWGNDDGCIFKVTPTGATSVWSTATHRFPNGLAFDAAGEYLYVAESTLPGVSRIALDASGSECERVVDMPRTVPDGLAFDEVGNLLIACYRPDAIYMLSRAGHMEVLLEDYQGTQLSAPTNVAFGGKDNRSLYIASLGRWHIGMVTHSSPGLVLRMPPFSHTGSADA